MNPYTNYPRLWTPPIMPSLFIVKVPASTKMLTETFYPSLMQQRVNWMIQQWMEETGNSQVATQALLVTTLSEAYPNSDYPLIDQDDINDWRQAWAETLILSNSTFGQAMSLLGVTFPAMAIAETDPEFQDFLELHQETHLEEWLTDLMTYA
jgi:hypothetical protein